MLKTDAHHAICKEELAHPAFIMCRFGLLSLYKTVVNHLEVKLKLSKIVITIIIIYCNKEMYIKIGSAPIVVKVANYKEH